MIRPRIIVNAIPDDYVLVGRVVRKLTAPDYQWPEDGIASLSFCSEGQESWQGRIFGARRNKSSITIYGPGESA